MITVHRLRNIRVNMNMSDINKYEVKTRFFTDALQHFKVNTQYTINHIFLTARTKFRLEINGNCVVIDFQMLQYHVHVVDLRH